jgi:hypothetical protein
VDAALAVLHMCLQLLTVAHVGSSLHCCTQYGCLSSFTAHFPCLQQSLPFAPYVLHNCNALVHPHPLQLPAQALGHLTLLLQRSLSSMMLAPVHSIATDASMPLAATSTSALSTHITAATRTQQCTATHALDHLATFQIIGAVTHHHAHPLSSSHALT